jgi:hypothetical protein
MQHRSPTTRRTFLKGLGVAGAAAAAAPHVVPARVLGADAPSNKLNIALLGAGGRGQGILPWSENVIAAADANAGQLARLKNSKRPGAEKVKLYEDYRKLLDQEKSLEGVVVAAGQRWHVYMSKAAMLAGKHVFCEKPLCHSAAEAREIRELAKKCKVATQIGSQGGSSGSFRRSMEVIQAGVLGPVREVHCWITRSFPKSAAIDTNEDPIPEGLNWDCWCGPSKVLPFKKYYLGGCLAWGRWLEYGDGHLADMGAHGLNLPWRALKLGTVLKASVEIPEPLKDSYPSATKFRWDFAARGNMPEAALYWHDGPKAGPPEELGKELLSTYKKVPNDGVLFAGEKGILFSNAWGVGGVVRLKGDEKCRGVLDHEACKPVPATLPKGTDHMGEWLRAAKAGEKTFQGFETAADIAEIAMVGIITLRLGKPIEWDSEALKVKGMPEADPLVQREPRKKWL